jgi:DNA-directed RNA polymerase subunit omega
MARVSVQDCLDKIPNRFAVVMLAARRMRQLQKGSDPLIECKNKEAVTALREIAAGVVGVKEFNRVQGLAESLEKTKARLVQRSNLSHNTER